MTSRAIKPLGTWYVVVASGRAQGVYGAALRRDAESLRDELVKKFPYAGVRIITKRGKRPSVGQVFAEENPTGAETALIVIGIVAGVAVVGGVAYAVTRKKKDDTLNVPDSIQPNHTYKVVVTAPAGMPIVKKFTRPELQKEADQQMPGVVQIVSGPDYLSNDSGVTVTLIVKYLGTKAITRDADIAAAEEKVRGQLREMKMTLTITDQG